MEPVNYDLADVFQIAMSPAYYLPDTYFIFRSEREQIVITIIGNTFISTHFLNGEEINHIKKYYPFLEIINYKVRAR
jgi:hypothetical protein